MIKVEVTSEFTYKDYEKLKNITRKSIDVKGKLFVGDTFECDKEIYDYLNGGNKDGYIVVKILEVVPEKEMKEKEVIETITTSVGTFGYGPVEVKETKLRQNKKKKSSKK